jgi:hypothetical protein
MLAHGFTFPFRMVNSGWKWIGIVTYSTCCPPSFMTSKMLCPQLRLNIMYATIAGRPFMRVPLSFMLPRRTVAVQCSAVQCSAVHVHYASRAGGEEVTVIPCFPATMSVFEAGLRLQEMLLIITNTRTGQRKQATTMSQIAIL